jgi:hypothetical protein
MIGRSAIRMWPAALLLTLTVRSAAAQTDPLPSWSDGAAKRAIVAFVTEATREGAKGFVPQAERIAVFDNDGTLWSEQPAYFQIAFALDRVKALAPKHPEWKTQETDTPTSASSTRPSTRRWPRVGRWST